MGRAKQVGERSGETVGRAKQVGERQARRPVSHRFAQKAHSPAFNLRVVHHNTGRAVPPYRSIPARLRPTTHLKKKRQANCLPRVRNYKRVFWFNRRFRPSPSISSQFVGQGKPLCCPSSRSVGIERYPRNEQMCRRSDIRRLPSLSRSRPAD
jgi:hypothetical protein